MSKPLVSPALAQLVAATTGRNMTKAAYVAVATGVAMMLLLTVNPAYEAAHRWVDAVLWACLAFFIFEWVVRLRHAFLAQRGLAYAVSGRGLVDAVCAAAIPLAMLFATNARSAASWPACQRVSRATRQCGAFEARTAIRGRSSEKRI